jgi:hypothetical protein
VTGSENEDERNFFRWNLAWVFQRERYEGGEFDAVVRKVARVLKHCEVRENARSFILPLSSIGSIMKPACEC